MKKIIMLFLLLISLAINVKAEEIAINGNIYNMSTEIEGEGFLYNKEEHILYLDNYYGKEISFSDDLHIVIRGNCVINSDSEYGLNAHNITLEGASGLYIINTLYGIKADNLTINGLTIYTDNKNIAIDVLENITITKSQLLLKANDIGINNHNKIYINDSQLNIYSNFGIVANNLELIKDNVLIETTGSAFKPFSVLRLNNTTMKLKCHNASAIMGGVIIFENDYQVYTSNEDEIYYLDDYYLESTYYYNYKYLVLSNEEVNNLLESDTSLMLTINEGILDPDNHQQVNEDDIVNPNTVDNYWFYVNLLVVSTMCLLPFMVGRRKHGKN